jgi:UDP-N-acetylmuramyl tripeptide synthase
LEAIVSGHGVESSDVTFVFGNETSVCHLNMPGRYNVYNAAAAVATAVVSGIPLPLATQAVGAARGAFGRAESIEVAGHAVRLFLVKNPTGADEVFRVVAESDRDASLALLLSDNSADGEDVSWVWDAQFELLMPWRGPIVCGGTRAEDMALRIKYADRDHGVTVVPRDVGEAVRQAIERAGDANSVTILATYTAMLAARAELARRGHINPYWQVRT